MSAAAAPAEVQPAPPRGRPRAPRCLPRPAPSASVTALAAEAISLASAALRRLMRNAGCTAREIETLTKRHRRLIARIRAGQRLSSADARFVAGALTIAATLYRTAHQGDNADSAALFEQAAQAFASVRFTFVGAAVPRPPPAPDSLGSVGHRVIEIASGRTFWIDEHDPRRPNLVGVIPDAGEPTLQWRPKDDFVRVRAPAPETRP